jgi:CubicO group peptidase (beta-lactamase class C family)
VTDDLARPEVTLANWQEPAALRWAFQHMRELIPSQVIEAGDTSRPLPETPAELAGLPLDAPTTPTFEALIGATETDAVIVCHHGSVIFERYYDAMTPRTRHLVMSVSKSVVSCVAGSLAADGLLDPEAPVESYVPELAGSGYAAARVRTLLDMRSGIRFREAYTDASAEVRVMERSMGWAPIEPGDPAGLYPYILTIEP